MNAPAVVPLTSVTDGRGLHVGAPGWDRVDVRPDERVPVATLLLTVGLVAEIFSGNWANFGVPGALDRVLIGLGFVVLVLGGVRLVSARRFRWRPIHVLLIVASVYATGSAIAAQTISDSRARFALLDRFGFVPFLLFAVAPMVFARERQRRFLLGVLVLVGAYVGLTNLFETVHLNALVFPKYITNPAIGLHFGRARGPFVEAVADGLSLIMCGTAAAIGLTVWRSRLARLACGAVIALAAFGVLFTLTRAVWIAAVVGPAVALALVPRLRRLILPLFGGVLAAVVLAFLLVPGLSSKADSRLNDQVPVWDRYNTDATALRMVETRPVFGFGWQTFPTLQNEYVRQADGYPITSSGNEVHNVFLSHAAELGIVGSALWTLALLSAVCGAIVRRGPPELLPWRIGLVAVFVAFLVVANFGPLSYPFPNALLWTWAGVAGAPFFLETAEPRAVKPGREVRDGPTRR